MVHLILGSQSPRRKEILGHFSIPFTQATSDYDEDSHPIIADPAAYALELATGKAQALAARYPDEMILSADTVVWKNNKFYGKAKTRDEAAQMLTELQGSWHSVFTAAVLLKKGKIYSGFEETRVLFNPLSEHQIRLYHDRVHWKDKAGAYAIQMCGGMVVQKIVGCYYNVMGLPINTVRSLLLNVGIDLWEYLK